MNYKKYRKKRRLLRLAVMILSIVPLSVAVLFGLQITDHLARTRLCPEMFRISFVDRMFLRSLMNRYEGNTVLADGFYVIVALVALAVLAGLVMCVFRKRTGALGVAILIFVYAVDIAYCLLRLNWITAAVHGAFVVLLMLSGRAWNSLKSFEDSVWG
ncbi:MAG: hypothetical protein J5822_07590 [Eubacteriaceae bacterium]|nr:hypothetical protein [Eubacteriaceae bacterium]